MVHVLFLSDYMWVVLSFLRWSFLQAVYESSSTLTGLRVLTILLVVVKVAPSPCLDKPDAEAI